MDFYKEIKLRYLYSLLWTIQFRNLFKKVNFLIFINKKM